MGLILRGAGVKMFFILTKIEYFIIKKTVTPKTEQIIKGQLSGDQMSGGKK